MGAPQIALIILTAINFGMMLIEHGKPKQGNENAWVTLMSIIVTYTLLISGGFFK